MDASEGTTDCSLQGSAKASASDSVTLQGLTAGKSRLEAARWFFEALVLQTKDFVDLQQVRAPLGSRAYYFVFARFMTDPLSPCGVKLTSCIKLDSATQSRFEWLYVSKDPEG